jgi:hypothetical protein
MNLLRGVLTATLAASAWGACGEDASNEVRGRGLVSALLSPVDEARVYEASARAAFDLGDPTLSLLFDRRLLPRTVGLGPAGTVTGEVTGELRRRGVIMGTCEPPLEGLRGTAQCQAALPGYVVRVSPVLAQRGDTVQVYLYFQKYDTPASGISQTLRFERAYQVVRDSDGWRAVREGRVSKEVRGEGT